MRQADGSETHPSVRWTRWTRAPCWRASLGSEPAPLLCSVKPNSPSKTSGLCQPQPGPARPAGDVAAPGCARGHVWGGNAGRRLSGLLFPYRVRHSPSSKRQACSPCGESRPVSLCDLGCGGLRGTRVSAAGGPPPTRRAPERPPSDQGGLAWFSDPI